VLRAAALYEELVPGAVVARRFCARSRIASGAMGEVWAGDHLQLGLKVALKVLRQKVQAHGEIVARFTREAFLLGQIQSNHVARVYDFVPRGKYGPVLVMEFIEGPSLAEVLASKRLAVEEAIDLGMDIVGALRELHAAKVVHRDVKPANVMLRPRHDRRMAVLVDLGVSRLLPEESADDSDQLTEITSGDRTVGTIEFMAPEQILSARDATPAMDLYAVGSILFRAVAGHNVFGELSGIDLARTKLSDAPPPLLTGRDDRVARGFEDIVGRALSRSPSERFESADALLAELSALRESGVTPVANERSLPPARTTGWLGAGRGWPLLSALLILAALLAGVALGARVLAPRGGSAALAAPADTDRCRVVGHRIETGPGSGARKVLFTIECPESDTPPATGGMSGR
jgi:serine/threonine-protein kinase